MRGSMLMSFSDNFSNNNLLFHGFVIYLFVISNLNFDDILISVIGAWLLFRVHLRIGGNASIRSIPFW